MLRRNCPSATYINESLSGCSSKRPWGPFNTGTKICRKRTCVVLGHSPSVLSSQLRTKLFVSFSPFLQLQNFGSHKIADLATFGVVHFFTPIPQPWRQVVKYSSPRPHPGSGSDENGPHPANPDAQGILSNDSNQKIYWKKLFLLSKLPQEKLMLANIGLQESKQGVHSRALTPKLCKFFWFIFSLEAAGDESEFFSVIRPGWFRSMWKEEKWNIRLKLCSLNVRMFTPNNQSPLVIGRPQDPAVCTTVWRLTRQCNHQGTEV